MPKVYWDCAGKARVIQIGGGSRDLYYYPKDTILVTVIAPKLNKGGRSRIGVVGLFAVSSARPSHAALQL